MNLTWLPVVGRFFKPKVNADVLFAERAAWLEFSVSLVDGLSEYDRVCLVGLSHSVMMEAVLHLANDEFTPLIGQYVSYLKKKNDSETGGFSLITQYSACFRGDRNQHHGQGDWNPNSLAECVRSTVFKKVGVRRSETTTEEVAMASKLSNFIALSYCKFIVSFRLRYRL